MEELKTKTLAEIYLRQGHLRDAYEILQFIAERDPSDQEIQEKLKDLKEKIERVRPLQKWLTNIQNQRKDDRNIL